jgi:ABC-type polysaccharide/polyol phosphate transport system ATPase subunit
MSDTIVKAAALSKRFRIYRRPRGSGWAGLLWRPRLIEEKWALKDVSFEIQGGQSVGLIGRNGSGKSTLLRILGGIYSATSGSVSLGIEPQILFSFSAGLMGDLPVEETARLLAVLYNLPGRKDPRVREDVLAAAGILEARYSPTKDLSQGQRQRLVASAFFRAEGNLLLIDEYPYLVDQTYADYCDSELKRLAHSGKTLIIASHDAAVIARYCDTAIWLENGSVFRAGPCREILAEYSDAKVQRTAFGTTPSIPN